MNKEILKKIEAITDKAYFCDIEWEDAHKQIITLCRDTALEAVNLCETRVSNQMRLNETSVMIFKDDVIKEIDQELGAENEDE